MKPAEQQCRPLAPGTPPPEEGMIRECLSGLAGWSIRRGALGKRFSFGDHAHTMAFVNAVAWIARQQDHHPEMTVGFDYCEVAFSTHSTGGISMNDFICAARVEALF